VTYFSGFSLSKEHTLFDVYLHASETTVVGFSFGSQQAFEYVYKSTKRIDRLILLSPAFFQTQTDSFVRTQLRYFETDKKAYVKQFLSNVAYPFTLNLDPYVSLGTKDELHALLTYTWEKEKIQAVLDRGVQIELFVGDKDKIVDAKETLAFFSGLVSSYTVKDAGHLLKTKVKKVCI
jgi:pimeloyl-ACP methyl ester carboxylesterase